MLEKRMRSRTIPESRTGSPPKPVIPAFSPSNSGIRHPTPPVQAPLPLNITFLFTGLLIFNHFGRPFETVLVGLKIPAVICGISILLVLFGGALKLIKSPIGIALGVNILWMTVITPISTWRGGSARYVLWYVAFWLVLTLIVGVSPRSISDIARIGYITLFSCLFHLLINGGSVGGRYALSGTFGNSDDVALLAGYAIPFMVLFAMQRKQLELRYGLLAVGVLYLLVLVGRTGTRAAIPALIGMLAVYFVHSHMSKRVAILAFALVASVVMLLVLPSSTLERLKTILDAFASEQTAQQLPSTEAMDSTMERRDLMKDAITITLRHPITGVGPGEFPEYRSTLRYANGQQKRFFPSHNTYLQISSEAGITGLIIYLVFLTTIYRTLRRIRKLNASQTHPQWLLVNQITVCLEAALVYFMICAFFMTCDRHPHQFILAGMAIALERMMQSWLKQNPGPGPQPRMAVPAPPLFGRQTQASLVLPARLR